MEFDFRKHFFESFEKLSQDYKEEVMDVVKTFTEIQDVPEFVAQLSALLTHTMANQQVAFFTVLEEYHRQLMNLLETRDAQ